MLAKSELSSIPQRFELSLPDRDPVEAELDYRPNTLLPAITIQDGKRNLEELRWGLLPSWAKDIQQGNRAFNARAEGIEAKPTFRKAVREHRCLLPASAYFEWQNVDATAKRKQPWRFTVGTEITDSNHGSELFAFAGIWDTWKNPANAEWIHSAAMITCEPNAVAEGIHNRMPVILPKDAEAVWLDPATPLEGALKLLVPYTGEMHVEKWGFTGDHR